MREDFLDKKTERFNISKVPDVYDNIKYDMIHNNDLMMELSKIEKVIHKQIAKPPKENLLVLDGTSGQNALSQIEKFKQSIDLTGIIITKLDSTSKAGFAISASYDYDLPIKLIGIGENLEDLVPFVPDNFSKALFDLQ